MDKIIPQEQIKSVLVDGEPKIEITTYAPVIETYSREEAQTQLDYHQSQVERYQKILSSM